MFGGAHGAWAEDTQCPASPLISHETAPPPILLPSLYALPVSILPGILNWGAFQPCWSLFGEVIEYGCMSFLELSFKYYHDFKNLTEYSGSVIILACHSNVAGVICLESLKLSAISVIFCAIQRAKLELPMFVVYSVFEIIKN